MSRSVLAFLAAGVVFALVAAASQQGNGAEAPQAAGTVQAPGVAVVELFTSQGCSSCPPADELLGRLGEAGGRVICLSFHVDYWDRLGWTDPYGQAAFTDRQRAYAQALGEDRVYTPQMVVDGTRGFVGSNADLAKKAIDEALARPARTVVRLDATVDAKDRQAEVWYHVVGQGSGDRLQVAMVQPQAANEVPRGENQGRTLTHANVVRSLRTVVLDRTGKGHLSVPLADDVPLDKLEVVAFTQDKDTMRIGGARRVVPGDPEANRLALSDRQWRMQLTPAQYEITRQDGTEPRNTGADSATAVPGVYTCNDCGARMFDAGAKFHSGTGWPSFWKPIDGGAAATAPDFSLGMVRTEVVCVRCGAHIGHVFDDGPQPTGQRWCLNARALTFIAEDQPAGRQPADGK